MLYGIAGSVKALSFVAPSIVARVENVPEILGQAAAANAGTLLSTPTEWLAGHGGPVTALVAAAMLALALVYGLDRGPVRAAAVGNVAMLACFVAILHRMAPQVIGIDLPMMAIAALAFRRRSRRATST